MSKRRSPPGVPIPTTAPLTFTVDEIFEWVCDRQHINPEHLTDARWRSLCYIAEQTTRKLNALFAEREVMA